MIEFQDVAFLYEKSPFLEGLNLQVEKGGVTTLAGPNGSGKSTLLRLAAGLLRPKQGAVLLEGRDIRQIRRKEYAKKVALLRQGAAVPPLCAGDVVLAGRYPYRGMGLTYSAHDKEVAEAVMKQTGCLQWAGKRLDQLSGGERQRVLLAAALAQEADLLLLDEPTTYLDIPTAMGLMELIQRINGEQGKTVLMVLHNLDLALRYSHRLVLMKNGRMLKDGVPEELVEGGALGEAFGLEVKRFREDGETYYCFV